ncbi:hypothetical protein [Promicromonospora sp. NPDC057488]|uniref:hypothetical protein n=1 Tax=Promicromonospora sp. NPDC057488 TaxID=3346147 RepID=UPI003670446A
MTGRLRMRTAPVVLVTALVLSMTACSPGDAARCEEAFAAAALSVPGVASAEWECSDSFGGGWERADVVLEATTKEEAVETVDAVLRAIAASPDLDDGWQTPQAYPNEDGSIIVSAGDVGFNAVPNVDEVREHYGITPG